MIRRILAVSALLLAVHLAAGREEKSTVEQACDAWRLRYSKLRAVRYEVSGKVTIPRGSIVRDGDGKRYPQPFPQEDLTYPTRTTMLLDLARNRFRSETRESIVSVEKGSAVLRPRSRTTAFDGHVFSYTASRRGVHLGPNGPDGSPLWGRFREPGFTYEEWPYFIAHGLVPTSEAHILPGNFPPMVAEKWFRDTGAAPRAGRPCVILRSEPDLYNGNNLNEYWVDLARGGAVLRLVGQFPTPPSEEPVRPRRDSRGGDNPNDGTGQVDIDMRYQETPAGWLPAGWTMTQSEGARTSRIYEQRVESNDLAPVIAKAEFDLTASPGTTVNRVHVITRAVPADPVAEPDEGAVATEEGAPPQPDATPALYSQWAVSAAVVVAFLLFAWWYRGRRTPAEAQTNAS